MTNQQERGGLKLQTLRSLLRLSLAFMWFASAVVSAFLYPKISSYWLLHLVGIPVKWYTICLYGASFIHFMVGLSLLFNYKIKVNCVIQLGVIVLYTGVLSVVLPSLWLEPFGPLVKNIPIIVSIGLLYCLETKSCGIHCAQN